MSWSAKVELVSDSAKFRITSRKEGMDPVVIALTRGIVMVGDVAWAVKGIADPSRMRLWGYLLTPRTSDKLTRSVTPLGKFESGFSGVYKITVAVRRIDCDEGS